MNRCVAPFVQKLVEGVYQGGAERECVPSSDGVHEQPLNKVKFRKMCCLRVISKWDSGEKYLSDT